MARNAICEARGAGSTVGREGLGKMYVNYKQYRGHTLKPLSILDHWKVREGEPDIRGWALTDHEHKKIASADDLLVDTDLGKVAVIVVAYDEILGLGGEKTLVPLELVDLYHEQKHVVFHGSEDDLKSGPRYTKDTDEITGFFEHWERHGIRTREEREMAHGRKGGEAAVKEHEQETERHRQSGKVNLNDAGRQELIDVPGIGPVIADHILKYRREHGQFKKIDDLDQISGINKPTIDDLRKYVTV